MASGLSSERSVHAMAALDIIVELELSADDDDGGRKKLAVGDANFRSDGGTSCSASCTVTTPSPLEVEAAPSSSSNTKKDPTPGNTRFFNVSVPQAEEPTRTTRVDPRARWPEAPQRRSWRSYLSVVAISSRCRRG